ncbi:MAG: 5'-3' exonuclease H3TH domain-containing protein [bacterium]|nr:5'-3' exonuclease H3TH domain-containing protein [bacterium]
MRTLLLIDANSIIHRSFHALPPLTGPGGRPTGSLYGLASILLKLWREEKPDYATALFDRPEPTFRKEKYAAYKAQRPAAPDELISQIIEAHNLFPAFNIKTFEKPGFEADDLIATFAERFKQEKDLQIVILTGDRDTLQLVEDDKVVVRTFKTGVSETFVYNKATVKEKYGLEPRQLIDYKALVGDPSDNIKGVPGVGPKTATEILQRYNTLENAYKNLANDSKLEKRLGPFRKDAELSKDLVTLVRNIPVDVNDIEELKTSENNEKIKEYFSKLGFAALIKRLEGDSANAGSLKNITKKKLQKPML